MGLGLAIPAPYPLPSHTHSNLLPKPSQPTHFVTPIRILNFLSLGSRILLFFCSLHLEFSQDDDLREGMKDKPKLTDKKFEKKLEFYSIKKKKKIRTRQTKLKAYNLSSLAECLPDLVSSKQETPAGRGETCAEETSVNLFFSEIVNLAAARINGMVERLELPQEIRERVYSLFQQILSHRTRLLFNRHIDQIVLCCFYGIAKVSQLSLTFKEIIHGYRKQPNYVSQVIRHVYVDDTRSSLSNVKTGQNHVDIIMFYNEVFLPAVKPLLLELAEVAQTTNQVSETNNHDQGPCSGSPKVSVFPDMSPKKMDALISHGSESSCYAQCVGDTTHEYQSPLMDLTAIDSRLNGNCAIVSGSCGGS
ncbi:putative transcription repressor RB family [Helianthus annuus]|nr:putative transcription repressor RB family [Helianthus annuus]KAJ0760624.1 putative transcription repressor RB family [Helianthus annuus]